MIRYREYETLKSFMGKFNNETLKVPDLKIDMMVNIFINGLKKGPFASALARDQPADVEQLMGMAQKYIDEEDMNAMKDEKWQISRDVVEVEIKCETTEISVQGKEREPPYQHKYHKYMLLTMTRVKALMMVEKSDVR
ncbi:UNVERIFIED_CONTAM: hypothetical protein Sindi_0382600 [Sesamum indicum]